MFEVESEEFIFHVGKEKLYVPWTDRFTDSRQGTGLFKWKRTPAQYATASGSDLEHASAVALQILRMLNEENSERKVVLWFDGESALRKSMRPSTSLANETRADKFHLKLSEAVAIDRRNFGALENAALSLSQAGNSRELFLRASDLIESFCSSLGEAKDAFDRRSPGLVKQDNQLMVRVLSLAERLASRGHEEMPGSYAMCLLFARICTSFANCDNLKQMKLAAKYLLRIILSSSYSLSEPTVRALKTYLGSILGRMGSEHRSIALLLFARFSAQRNLGWLSNGAAAIDGNWNPSSPALDVQLFSMGAFEQDTETFLAALGDAYVCGYQNNGADPVEAKELYSLALKKGNIIAMNNLAMLLEDGAEGGPADCAKAAYFYSRAMDEGGHIPSVCNLARFYRFGAERVVRDPVRALELYSHAVDFSGDVRAMKLLASLYMQGAEGMDADPGEGN